jgi:hypothetical protein
MKRIATFIVAIFLLASCTSTKMFNIDGNYEVVRSYGWANKASRYNEKVVYEPNAANVVFSILGVQTVAIPVWLTGWHLFHPVGIKPEFQRQHLPDSDSTVKPIGNSEVRE